MKLLKVENATFRRYHLFETRREVSEAGLQVVSHSGGKGVVFRSFDKYDKEIDVNEFINAVAKWREAFEKGESLSNEESKNFL